MGQGYIPDLPMFTGTGIRTPTGMHIPLGKIACFLSSQGADYYNDSTIANIGCAATLSAALPQCRTGRADTILALPGHSESLTSATAFSGLVAGTKIVGIGRGTAQPTLRWVSTASIATNAAINVANVIIDGMYLRLEGYTPVAAPITVTGSDCLIRGCRIQVASASTYKCTTAISMGATTTADRFTFINNQVFGIALQNVTDFIKIDGVIDGVVVRNNTIIASATAANGFVHVTDAATHLDICDNDMYNEHTSSTACIAFDNVAATGICYRNQMAVLSAAGASSTTGIIIGANCLVKFNQNYNVDVKGFSGVLTPVVTTG
jgi:hypothetical protein